VFTSCLDYAGFLVGALVAGAAAAALGLDVALWLCAAPFAVGVLALLGVPADRKPELLPGEEPEAPLRAILGGVRAVNADRGLRILTAIFGTDMLVQGVLDVLLVLVALELLGMGDDGVGWLNAGWGAGGLAGGALALWLLRRRRLGAGLVLGCVLVGVPFALLAAVQEPVAAIALLVVLGVGFAVTEIALDSFTQRLTAADLLGRVFGLHETLFVGMSALGSLLAAALVALVGLEATLVITGLALPVAALATHRPLVALEAGAPVPERTFALLRGVPLFALLPVATVETLAARARRAEFADGVSIVREGEHGDLFYVVEDGTVEVSVEGGTIRRQAAAEFFGEIALLHDCPRTATVTADGHVIVLAVDRTDFLDSLGVHARSAKAARTVADERLGRNAADGLTSPSGP
jgi:hypothetical protein